MPYLLSIHRLAVPISNAHTLILILLDDYNLVLDIKIKYALFVNIYVVFFGLTQNA
jgi:hypothetical protein